MQRTLWAATLVIHAGPERESSWTLASERADRGPERDLDIEDLSHQLGHKLVLDDPPQQLPLQEQQPAPPHITAGALAALMARA